MTLSNNSTMDLASIVSKVIELTVITFYLFEVLPKIFIWKKPSWWKFLNGLLITSIVILVPLSIVDSQNLGIPYYQLKLKVMSLCLSLLLFMEIVTGRDDTKDEEDTLTMLQKVRRNPNGYKDCHHTWEEIVEHDRRSDCWVVVHGKVYDLTNFVDIHPGGEIIYDGAGGDCTPMWESYHPLATVKSGPPEKYCVGYVRDYEDFYSWDGEFYDTLRERVEAAVPRKMRRYDTRMYTKSAIILAIWSVCFYWYLAYNTFWSAVVFAIISGQVGVNIMHDGNHMAYSNNKWMNTLAG
jgi:hypothetical protein